jgi:hypothetical protein
MNMKKTMIAAGVGLALGAPVANATLVADLFGPYNWSTDRANFTMLTTATPPSGLPGALFGGTNDVAMTWDGNGYNASTDYTGPGSAVNVTASSTTPFSGANWTAHDIQVFTTGSYSFNTLLGGGANETGGPLLLTVGAGQLGMHMLFDWGAVTNIDVAVLATTPNTANPFGHVFGPGVGQSTPGGVCATSQSNCLWTGPGYVGGSATNGPTGTTLWMLSSIDGNGDGIMGIPMPTGDASAPFAGFNANFNANLTPTPDPVVPIPAAAWLFGSGLLGLVGIARRKKNS